MPLPIVPTTAATPATAASTVPSATAPEASAKGAIKQFGPAKDAAGNVIPAPTPLGVDLVDVSKTLFETLKSYVSAKGVDVSAFIDACELDKPTVPGHKEGRIAYNTANVLLNLSRSNGMLNKQRGATGMALANQKIAASENKIAKLKALLVSLGKSEAEIDVILTSAAA